MAERYIRRIGSRAGRALAAGGLALALAACGGDEPGGAVVEDGRDERSAPAVPAGERPVLLVVGTSLTAGLGVDPSEAYPARLQARIDSAGLPYRVVNAGVSGETSAGALARMDWLLRQDPAVVVIETGANDGLRGLDPDALAANLSAIVERARAAGPETGIALVQMEAPPNLGRAYTAAFRDAFRRVAADENVVLLPFPLAAVAGVDSLNQPDGIHPTPAGHALMADAIWPELEPLLRTRLTTRPAALR